MNHGPPSRLVRFGAFELDRSSGQLRKHGLRVRTPQQSIQILASLLERPGEVVTREELCRELWPDGVFVDFEHGLNTAVKKLRRSLGDSAESPKFIETLPRRGYRFIGTLEESPTPVPDPVHEAQRRTVLVRAVATAAILLGIAAIVSFRARATDSRSAFVRIGIARLTVSGKVTATAVSPEGRFVVYVKSEAGRESLRSRQLDSGEETELIAPGECRYAGLAVSPDGNVVYYLKSKVPQRWALFAKPVLGGPESRLIENMTHPIALSPDGRTFAFVRALASGESALMSANSDGSGVRKLAVRHNPEFFGAYGDPVRARPSWSPDGKLIASPASDYRGYHGYVVTVPASGGAETILTKQKWFAVHGVAWTKGGEGLVAEVSEEIAAPAQLQHISYPDGANRHITTDLNGYSSLSMTADSTALVALHSTTLSDIWIVPVGKSGEARQLGDATPRRSAPASIMSWTPDGRLLYVSRAGGRQDIWMAESDGSKARRLTWFGKTNLQPRVCAAGRFIVFMSDRAGNINVWRMNMDGSEWRQLTFGQAESRPDCSPDGRWVYYTAHAATQRSIWKAPLDGGEPVQFIEGYSVSPAASPDGKWVAFRSRDGQPPIDRIAIMRPDANASYRHFDFDAQFVRWTPDSRALLYLMRDRGVDNIWSQTIEDGPPTRLTDFTSGWISNFDWSGAGNQLACARGYEENDIVLIRDNSRN